VSVLAGINPSTTPYNTWSNYAFGGSLAVMWTISNGNQILSAVGNNIVDIDSAMNLGFFIGGSFLGPNMNTDANIFSDWRKYINNSDNNDNNNDNNNDCNDCNPSNADCQVPC